MKFLSRTPDDANLMSEPDQWLREARDCLEAAQAAGNSHIKDAWIELAIEWMKLAGVTPEALAGPGIHGTQKPN